MPERVCLFSLMDPQKNIIYYLTRQFVPFAYEKKLAIFIFLSCKILQRIIRKKIFYYKIFYYKQNILLQSILLKRKYQKNKYYKDSVEWGFAETINES